MPVTTCKIASKIYRLEYQKTAIASGHLYRGTVFMDHIFEFSFVVFNNGDPTLFSPLTTPLEMKNAVIDAIKEDESA